MADLTVPFPKIIQYKSADHERPNTSCIMKSAH